MEQTGIVKTASIDSSETSASSRSRQTVYFLVLVAVCMVLFFIPIGQTPFFNRGEPREALVVQDIVHQGQWLFPLKMGEVIPSKPPLFHWAAALTSLFWGEIREATIRFPSALFGTFGVLLVYLIGRKVYDGETGFVAGLVLATSLGYQAEAVEARVDMTLVFFLTTALMTFLAIDLRLVYREFWYYIFFVILGLSVLAKGPVSFILAVAIIGVFLALQRQWDKLYRLCFHPALLLGVSIFLLWYGIGLMKSGGDLFGLQIVKENVTRFFVHGEEGTGHQKPVYYYVPYLFLQGLPWSIFLPFLIIEGIKDKIFAEPRSRFFVTWVFVVFLFFSLSAGKRPVYILPLYPALALLTAWWLGRVDYKEMGWRSIVFKSLGWFFVAFSALILIAVTAMLLGMEPSQVFDYWGIQLRAKDEAHIMVIKNTLGASPGFYSFLAILFGVFWFLAGRHFISLKVDRAAKCLIIASFLSGTAVQNVLMPVIAEARTYKPFVREMKEMCEGAKEIYIHGIGWDYGPVIFYAERRVHLVHDDYETLSRRLQQSGDCFIMGEKEWLEFLAASSLPIHAQLRSRGTGPSGEDPIVLIQGLKG